MNIGVILEIQVIPTIPFDMLDGRTGICIESMKKIKIYG